MVSFVRLAPCALDDRIDATYYRPEYVANAQRLTSSSVSRTKFRSLVSAGRRTLYFGTTTLEGDEAPDDWVPFLTSDDLGDAGFFIETRARRRVAPSFLQEYPAGRLRPGELLVKVKGPNQTTAYVDRVPEYPVLVSGTIWGGLVCKNVDPYYLVAALSCPYAAMARTRLRTNLNVEFLGAEDLLSLLLPVPDSLAQRYIGDKVRQANRLNDRARHLEDAVALTHAQYIAAPTGIDFKKRNRRLAACSLTERLDAHFYPSAVEQYFRQVVTGATRSLDQLCSLVVNGQSRPEATEGVRQATVTNLGRSFLEGSLRIVERPIDGSRALAPHDLLLCNAAHNKSYIGNDVTYSQVEGPYPSTEVMVVRVDRTQLPASFVRQYLKTKIGYLQIQSTIRGITAHSYPADVKLLNVPIPAVPDVDRDGWFATDDKMLAAGRCFDAAKVLTGVATALVEHLIDGRITEAELIAAQQAIEASDRSADRNILQALCHGDAPAGKPVIPNVDALYALLDDAEERVQ